MGFSFSLSSFFFLLSSFFFLLSSFFFLLSSFFCLLPLVSFLSSSSLFFFFPLPFRLSSSFLSLRLGCRCSGRLVVPWAGAKTTSFFLLYGVVISLGFRYSTLNTLDCKQNPLQKHSADRDSNNKGRDCSDSNC